MKRNVEIAMTIQQQLGGAAMMMMGARDLIAVESGLRFRIGRNVKGWSGITIELDPSDTYTVRLWKVRKRGGVPELVAETSRAGLYADQLRGTIEAETGLALSL